MSKAILPTPNSYNYLIGTEVRLLPGSVDFCPNFEGVILKVRESQFIANKLVAECKVTTTWGPSRPAGQVIPLYLKDLRGVIEQRIL